MADEDGWPTLRTLKVERTLIKESTPHDPDLPPPAREDGAKLAPLSAADEEDGMGAEVAGGCSPPPAAAAAWAKMSPSPP